MAGKYSQFMVFHFGEKWGNKLENRFESLPGIYIFEIEYKHSTRSKKTKKKHDLSFLIDCQSCASAQSFYGRWIGNFTVFMKLMPLLDGWWKLRLMKVTYSTRAFSFLRCCTRSLPYYNTIWSNKLLAGFKSFMNCLDKYFRGPYKMWFTLDCLSQGNAVLVK